MELSYSYQKIAILSALVVIVGVCNGQMICNMSMSGLMACKPSATPPNPPEPSAICCSSLSSANLTCLCGFKNSKLLPSLGIDPKLAVQLPVKCKIPNPPTC